MSTRTDQKTYDLEYFNFLFDYAYQDAPPGIKEWIRDNMIPNGDIAIESLLETAIAYTNNIKKYSTIGADFLNEDGTPGGDAKKATAFKNPNRPRLEARVTDFHNKTGDLYICIYESVLSKFYFFNVPHDFYKDRKNLTFYFDEDGTPRRNRLRIDSPLNLWKYQCHEGISELSGLKKN